jgi:ABC-2 type transport system permease protein
MSTHSFALRDTAIMLRRDLKHSLRRLSMTLSGVITPTLMLVLFNYFFGSTIGAGLGAGSRTGGLLAHGGAYINYLVPGILIMTTVTGGCEATAINVVTELNEGIITRFRTMAIARASVLTGQALGSLIRTLISAALVLGVGLLMGFRPSADPVAWVAAVDVIALFTFGITWMGVLFGLIGKSPAGANSLSLIFLLLSFTSSAFVRADTMPAGVRWFADYQPLTPVTDTLRGLLMGTPTSDNTVALAIAWSIALALIGYLLALAVYARSSLVNNLSATR